jgi:hypothetical protein
MQRLRHTAAERGHTAGAEGLLGGHTAAERAHGWGLRGIRHMRARRETSERMGFSPHFPSGMPPVLACGQAVAVDNRPTSRAAALPAPSNWPSSASQQLLPFCSLPAHAQLHSAHPRWSHDAPKSFQLIWWMVVKPLQDHKTPRTACRLTACVRGPVLRPVPMRRMASTGPVCLPSPRRLVLPCACCARPMISPREDGLDGPGLLGAEKGTAASRLRAAPGV